MREAGKRREKKIQMTKKEKRKKKTNRSLQAALHQTDLYTPSKIGAHSRYPSTRAGQVDSCAAGSEISTQKYRWREKKVLIMNKRHVASWTNPARVQVHARAHSFRVG